MKITMLINSLGRGGQERQLIELLKGMHTQSDMQIEVITFSKKVEYPEIFELGFPIHIIERKPKKDPRAFYKVYRLLQKFAPDVVHSWGAMASIYAGPACKLLGLKFINQNVMDSAKGLGWFDIQYTRTRVSYPFSDIIISNSKSGLASYDVPEKKALYIYNGFDVNRIANLENPKTVRQNLNIQSPKVVGMVGAFQQRKDYDTYIKAACKIAEQRKDVTFLAIGGGNNLESCKKLVPPQLKAQIIFTGMLPNVESVLNIFDVAVLCTNTKVHQEGISNSILEYMFFGKPVVATAGGGTNEIVFDNKTGLLVEPYDIDGLVQAITTFLDQPEYAHKIGQNARQLVFSNFSLDIMKEKYLDLYQKLLS